MRKQTGWPSINPGRFRHTIILLEESTATDASGVVTVFAAGVPPKTIYADIEYVSGSEIIKSGQDVTQSYLQVTGWFDAAFLAGKRIQVPDGTQYNIQNVDNVRQMNVYMTLYCQAIGPKT